MAQTLPESVTDYRINLVGFAGMLGAAYLVAFNEMPIPEAAVFLMAAMVIPIAVLDIVIRRVHRRSSTGLDWDRAREPMAWGRIATKWLGAAGMIGSVGLVYFLAPEYQGNFYRHFYYFLRWLGPPAAVLGLAYVAWLDGRMVEPRDGYWHFGRAMMGRFDDVDWSKVRDLARGWVIKGFFIPLMFTYLCHNIIDLRRDVMAPHPTFIRWFDSLWHFGFLVDLVFTTAGYLVTTRVLDTHLRSAQPHMSGWVVAIVCYQPFFSLISRQYLFYNNEMYWGGWLEASPTLRVAWGVVLLLTLVVFSGTTIGFGCRFSNLTNRGVITDGFYRWTKHPAYVSKLISFWMMFVPFVYRGSLYDVARDCFWLAVLSLIYWARAKTEEIHLSEDPDYVRYATAMNERSIFARVGRVLPFLRYEPPAGQTSEEAPSELGSPATDA